MKHQSLLLLLLLPAWLFAQFSPPNSFFQDLSTVPCPFDPSVEIVQPDHWQLYQTLDGHYDGPIDSSICISMEPVFTWGGIRVDLNQIDPARPLFVRWLSDETNKIPLLPDWLFLAEGYLNGLGNTSFDQSTQCADALCTGVIANVEIPDETGDSTVLRTYVGPFDDFYQWGYLTCMPTDRFEESYLRDFIVKVQVDTANIPAQNFVLQVSTVGVQMMYDVGHIYEVAAPEWTWDGDSYELLLYLLADDGFQNYLFMYGADTYPKLENPHFIDAVPEENSPEPKVININIFDFESAYFQPFTYLRGGLVEGSDSIRHEANLVNWGGNICVNFVELIFEGPSAYVHRSGQLDFAGETACMQFRTGGKLVVADSSTLHFGPGGHGMLALRTGSTIELGKGSTLLLDNMLMLTPYQSDPADPETRQVYMELNPGATLVFGPNASIMRKFNPEEDMRLNIYMNGGTLDWENLSPESRALINLIYPDPVIIPEGTLLIAPNPTADVLGFDYTTGEDTETIDVQVFNEQGQLLIQYTFPAKEGSHYYELPVANLARGWYVLRVLDPQLGAKTGPWVKF